MFKLFFLKPFALVLVTLSFLALHACKSSEFSDIFERCAPECTQVESAVPLAEVEKAFTQVINTIEVSTLNLTGRWVMLSASRYSINESKFRAFTDLLFTKSMVITEVGNTVQVSDCYHTEIYPLTDSGFTIPKESVFFSSLYFENQNAIVVNKKSNKLLSANWTFVTPQDTLTNVEVNMYKVNDSASATAQLGTVNGTDDIYCYSYLDVFTSAEQLFNNQWIPGQFEIKEMLLKIDPASGDENIALASKVSNGASDEYKIIYNQNIEGEEYECFGENSMENGAEDHLSFFGSFEITNLDIDCNKPLGNSNFEFSIQ